MRSKSDPISMLKDRMLGSNMASVEEFKVQARTHAEEGRGRQTSDAEAFSGLKDSSELWWKPRQTQTPSDESVPSLTFSFGRKLTSPSVKRWRRRLSSPHQTPSPRWRTCATTSSATTRPWRSVGRTPGLCSGPSARAWSWILDQCSAPQRDPKPVSVIYSVVVFNLASLFTLLSPCLCAGAVQMLQNAQTLSLCCIRK